MPPGHGRRTAGNLPEASRTAILRPPGSLGPQGTVPPTLGYTYRGAAQAFFTRWFWRVTHSRLKPMADVAKLNQRHLPNVLTYL